MQIISSVDSSRHVFDAVHIYLVNNKQAAFV